ncbi:hypothetical protein [Sphingobium sp. DC-2]|uniref:hypothetical protein n=1 Tax=Sphingobium sp. DC-2 TaxID=1303256 RepID=UPI0012DE87A2|nr:hypothetical protein [Sphingobium sp. DC-2]
MTVARNAIEKHHSAIAREGPAGHMRPAFQASSPKTHQAGRKTGLFFHRLRALPISVVILTNAVLVLSIAVWKAGDVDRKFIIPAPYSQAVRV